MHYLELAAGAVLLYVGAGWLVRGSSGLALALGIPSLVVGLTVVAFGTSAPEVVVSIQAALAGEGDIVLGNVVGSNIANIGLILGLATLVAPARVAPGLLRRDLPVLLASALVLALVLDGGGVGRLEGLMLLAAFGAYMAWTLAGSRGHGGPAPAGRAAGGAGRDALLAGLGLALLLWGGSLFVGGATGVARAWDISERLVGLTIVAAGTSLPEMMTSIVAALKREPDIAVGNVLGSNIFNALLCTGAAAVTRPLQVGAAALASDLAVMAALSLLAAFYLRTERRLRRGEGGLLLAAYLAYLGWLALS